MEDEGYDWRFVCKLCDKKYPCGKSLGGHMRSHVVANPAEFQDKVEFNLKKKPSFLDSEQHSAMKESKIGESGNGQSGYGLRENPKKTWRAVTRLPMPQDKVCKQCGKGFQSLKALCGHMACHSEKDKNLKDDHSWSSSENQKMVFDSQSDTEGEEKGLRNRFLKSKRSKKIVDNGSSSVSEIDGLDQEEVAMCLMLLSRDSGTKVGVNSVVESSDNNSVVVETKSSSIDMRTGRKESPDKLKDTAEMENSDSGYFLDECAKAESDVSVDWFRRSSECKKPYVEGVESRKRKYGSENHESMNELCSNSQKKSKYECLNCKKIFKSYQALGGHRPCHKRSYDSRDESGENSLDDSTYYRNLNDKNAPRYAEKKNKPKKNKAHACPFCTRVFKNGQALGGHKRSHFIGGNNENNNTNPSPVAKPELPDLLDLNLPAPEANEDDGCGPFFSWSARD